MSRTALQDGHWEFKCPGRGCTGKWNFIQMRNLLSASMTPEELEKVSKQVDANYIRQPMNDIRQCSTCGTYSQRDFNKPWPDSFHRAVCFTCTKRAKHTVEFCWYCGQQWKGGNGKSCGNSNCQGPADSLRILATCKTKEIASVSGVPDTRACPRCGVLISHTDYCKHMTCKMCDCNFCFVCLVQQDSTGNWPCGGPYSACPLHHRQTTIPEYIRK